MENSTDTLLDKTFNSLTLTNNITLQDLKNFQVDTYKFSEKDNKWESYRNLELGVISIDQKDLSFITYNVWFDKHNWENRLKALSEIFEKHSPDFICLQEVTSEFLKFILTSEYIRKDYYVSGNFNNSYDAIILSKYPTKFYVSEFPTRMGRRLILAEVNLQRKVNNSENEYTYEPFIVSTAHFESLNNANLRKAQLKQTFSILNKSALAFLMGDFNFDPSWKAEQANIDKSYNDSWELHANQKNLTTEDSYTMPATESFSAWRPDRILFRDLLNVFKYDHFEILGKDKIQVVSPDPIYSQVATPSDHYGLYLRLSINIEN